MNIFSVTIENSTIEVYATGPSVAQQRPKYVSIHPMKCFHVSAQCGRKLNRHTIASAHVIFLTSLCHPPGTEGYKLTASLFTHVMKRTAVSDRAGDDSRQKALAVYGCPIENSRSVCVFSL